MPDEAARQIVDYLQQGLNVLGAMPTRQCVVLERFFDESGATQLVLHAPFGSRINRAWGLALRKRFAERRRAAFLDIGRSGSRLAGRRAITVAAIRAGIAACGKRTLALHDFGNGIGARLTFGSAVFCLAGRVAH